jgi:hypothetical protein
LREGHLAPVDLRLHGGVAERQEELARALGRNRLAGGEDLALDQDLAAAVNEAT